METDKLGFQIKVSDSHEVFFFFYSYLYKSILLKGHGNTFLELAR